MQSMVAFVNLATYYAIGVPLGFTLINIFHFGVKVRKILHGLLIKSFLLVYYRKTNDNLINRFWMRLTTGTLVWNVGWSWYPNVDIVLCYLQD